MSESLKTEQERHRWWQRIQAPSSMVPYLVLASLFHGALFATLNQKVVLTSGAAQTSSPFSGLGQTDHKETQTALEREIHAALDEEVEKVLDEYVIAPEAQEGRVEAIPYADVYYRLDSYQEVLEEVNDNPPDTAYSWVARQQEVYADLQKKHAAGVARILQNHPKETWTGDLEKDLPQLIQAIYLDQNGFFREGNPTVSINLPQLSDEANRPFNEFQNVKTCASSRYIIPVLKEIYESLGFSTEPLKALKSILWDGHQAVYLEGVAGGQGRQYHHYGVSDEGMKSISTGEEGTVMNYGKRLAIWMYQQGLLSDEQKKWAETEERNSFDKEDLPDFVVRRKAPEIPEPKTKKDAFAQQLKKLSSADLESLTDHLKGVQFKIIEVSEGEYGGMVKNACAPGAGAFICFPPPFLADAQLATRFSELLIKRKKLYVDESSPGAAFEGGLFQQYDWGFSEMVFFWPELAEKTVLEMAKKEPPRDTPIPIYDARLQEWLEGVLGQKGYQFTVHPDASSYQKRQLDYAQAREQSFKDFVALNESDPAHTFVELEKREGNRGNTEPCLREYEYLLKVGRKEELKRHLWEKHFKRATPTSTIYPAPLFYGAEGLLNFPLTRALADEMNEEYLLTNPTEENRLLRLFYGLSVDQLPQSLILPEYLAGTEASAGYTLALQVYYRAETDAGKRQALLINLFKVLGSNAFELLPSRRMIDIIDRAWLEERQVGDFSADEQDAFLRLEFFYTDKEPEGYGLVLAEARMKNGLGQNYPAHGTPLEEARRLNAKKVQVVDIIDKELSQVAAERASRN